MTLYVGGLKINATDRRLRTIFGGFGEISESRVVMDDAGACRGFGYVTFADDLCAAKARVALNGKEINGQTLRVALAT